MSRYRYHVLFIFMANHEIWNLLKTKISNEHLTKKLHWSEFQGEDKILLSNAV